MLFFHLCEGQSSKLRHFRSALWLRFPLVDAYGPLVATLAMSEARVRVPARPMQHWFRVLQIVRGDLRLVL